MVIIEVSSVAQLLKLIELREVGDVCHDHMLVLHVFIIVDDDLGRCQGRLGS